MPFLLLAVPAVLGLGAAGIGYAADKTEDLIKTLVIASAIAGVGYLVWKRSR
jgi:hypothetical protein